MFPIPCLWRSPRARARLTIPVLLLACVLAPSAGAQLPARVDSTLHALFASRTFVGERFGPARWLAGGDSYTTVEPAADGSGADIVAYDAATGRRSVKVGASQLRPPGAAAPLDIEDYQWSADGARLLVFTNSRRVWRRNTRGDYWALDLRTGRLRQIGAGAPASSLMFAKFSPDGGRVAYVTAGDLYVEGVDDGRVTRLTHDASRTLVNGMTDWVYEEEFDLRDAFRWSPDGRAIAFWQFDMSGIRDFLLIDDTDSLYPFTIPVQYPKAGTTNSAVRLGVVPADGSAPPTWVQLAGDPRQNYLPRAAWASPTELVLQHMNRQQDRDAVMLADARTGAVRTVLTEQDSAWVDVVDDLRWLNHGTEFLWISERDGWRHAYAVSRDGRTVRLLTPGAYDVIDVASVDEPGGWLYVIASPANATQRYLYRVALRDPGPPRRVSPEAEPGSHAYDISPNGRWAFHSWSRADAPPVTELVALPAHARVRTLVTN
ncbi:MAG TPA: DPP IV N-terminal domain-containing protein, partial [Gemmatimonadaceae bacterium]|nr:DPP IV N-terminal domain-containing protein [Gemmatimonadaceae bacterium]